MKQNKVELRFHHLTSFVDYVRTGNLNKYFGEIEDILYGKDFVKKLIEFFNDIRGRKEIGAIKLVSGIDDICRFCPRQQYSCLKPDNTGHFEQHSILMERMELTENRLYTQKDFMERFRKLYEY